MTITTTMETKKTDAVVELADNGYILRYGGTVLVYSDKTGNCYRDMIEDIMTDLDNAIDAGGCSNIRVRVEVEPINDNDNEQKQ